MTMTVYNPQQARLETIEVEFTDGNTTWFTNCKYDDDIASITDFDGDILIKQFGYTYPIRIYDNSRADIGHSRKKARQLMGNFKPM